MFIDGPDPKQKRSVFFCFEPIVDSRVYCALVCWTGYLRSRSGVSLSLYVINILILYSQLATWFGSKFLGLQKMMPCIFAHIGNIVLEEFLTSFFRFMKIEAVKFSGRLVPLEQWTWHLSSEDWNLYHQDCETSRGLVTGLSPWSHCLDALPFSGGFVVVNYLLDSYVYWTVDHLDSWIKIDQLMSLALSFLLNMFRMLVHSSSGSCDCVWVYCSGSMWAGITVWFGWGGVLSLCRLRH